MTNITIIAYFMKNSIQIIKCQFKWQDLMATPLNLKSLSAIITIITQYVLISTITSQ